MTLLSILNIISLICNNEFVALIRVMIFITSFHDIVIMFSFQCIQKKSPLVNNSLEYISFFAYFSFMFFLKNCCMQNKDTEMDYRMKMVYSGKHSFFHDC